MALKKQYKLTIIAIWIRSTSLYRYHSVWIYIDTLSSTSDMLIHCFRYALGIIAKFNGSHTFILYPKFGVVGIMNAMSSKTLCDVGYCKQVWYW